MTAIDVVIKCVIQCTTSQVIVSEHPMIYFLYNCLIKVENMTPKHSQVNTILCGDNTIRSSMQLCQSWLL